MPALKQTNDEVSADKENIRSNDGDNKGEVSNCDCECCKEVEILKLKLNEGIPKSIIIYLIFSTIAFTVFATVFIISIMKRIIIISLESCIVGIISTFGLMLTSVLSIKDWRKFVKDVR